MPCNCEPETIHTPNPCQTEGSYTHSNIMRLFILRCGTWVYAGQMPMNNAPTRGMRLVWEDKAYTIEQSTLVGSEPGLDKWEVMLIQAGPAYYSNASQPCGGPSTTPIPGRNPCAPCPPQTHPPLEPGGGHDHDSPCTNQDPWYNYPILHNGPGGIPSIPYPNTGHGGHGHDHNGGNLGYGHNVPRPVEMGLGCGPHYECTGQPH